MIFFIFLVSCKNQSDIIFQYVDPLDKILPEQNLFYPYPERIEACRGEHASLQFVIRSPEKIRNLKTNLTSKFEESETTLHEKESSIYYVGYVHEGRTAKNSSNDLLYSSTRYYPDVLLEREQMDIEANANAVVWVSIPIPLETKPGSYEFELTINGKNKGSFKRTVSFTIEVHEAQIKETTLFINNWHYPQYLDLLSSGKETSDSVDFEKLEKLATIMHDYRQNTILLSPLHLADYTFHPDGTVERIGWDKFERTLNTFDHNMDLKLVAGKQLAKRVGGWKEEFQLIVPNMGLDGTLNFSTLSYNDPRTRNFYDKFLDSLHAFLTTSGWIERYVQHIADEPIDENISNYIQIARYVSSRMEGVRIIEAIHSLDAVDHVDIAVPQLDHLHRNYDLFQSYMKNGKEVWFYTCHLPQGEYANRLIRQPLIKTRLLHWINYKYGISGYLHWGMNHWSSSLPHLEVSAIQATGSVMPGGDSWIIYPDGESLAPSIRLEAMRDGIVDYELLKMGYEKDSLKVDNILNQIVFDFNSYEINIVRFRQLRNEILKILDN